MSAAETLAGLRGLALAVVHARAGRLPAGAEGAVAEAGGHVLVVGSGAKEAAGALPGRHRVFAETGPGLQPGQLATRLAPVLARVPLVVLPSSPDGRDLAPRLAAALGRPLLANALWARRIGEGMTTAVRAELARLEDRLLVEVETEGPAVVTLTAGPAPGPLAAAGEPGALVEVELGERPGPPTGAAVASEPTLVGERAPDLATMDLAEAARVVSGGNGLVAGADDATATATFGLLGAVAGALGGALGATRVATDAGWVDHARQIGTTGVVIAPELYVAFGISGAAQHVGGLGNPRTVVSVNLDPSCPMTRMADLGLVTDAAGLLLELAARLGVPVPEELARGCPTR